MEKYYYLGYQARDRFYHGCFGCVDNGESVLTKSILKEKYNIKIEELIFPDLFHQFNYILRKKEQCKDIITFNEDNLISAKQLFFFLKNKIGKNFG